MTPTISAVITTINRASIVPDAIRGVSMQTILVLEFNDIDDGSSDETKVSVLNAFEKISNPSSAAWVGTRRHYPGWPRVGMNASR